MLNDALIERILTNIPHKTIGVVGDLFLDRYLDIDAARTEPSIETGLDAYQVVGVRSFPGALGTVINNLVALGVGQIRPFAIIGDDGEGHELRQALAKMPAVCGAGIISWAGRRTPTYTKPMLNEVGKPPRELNRLDIKNRTPTPEAAVDEVRRLLQDQLEKLDALIVLDQVSEAECGVITASFRDWLAHVGGARPEKFILADSRECIHLFRNAYIKPNIAECLRTTGRSADQWRGAIQELAGRTHRHVFCTRGEDGIAVFGAGDAEICLVPGYPVAGPIDVVGAGDSCSAGIVCAIASGATFAEAAAFGNLIASITVQQIGVTGTASPDQVRSRWQEVSML